MKRIGLAFLALITTLSYCSGATRCEVSLPQHSTSECKALRNAALAKNKKTFTLKHDPALYGFARLNMTPKELAPIVFGDPFSRYYTTAYTQTLKTNEAVLAKYNNETHGQEINDLSEYLKMSEFFQSVLEPLIGEYARLASKYEDFTDNKIEWINDKYFTQQRLAGVNPMTIQRVTIHAQVKTLDGRRCRFPFKYRGRVYHKCTSVNSKHPWCYAPVWGRWWGYCAEPTGLDWNKLKETLNPKFDWEATVRDALKTSNSLENVISQGRIYACRYELCDDLAKQKDLTDKDPRREMWNFMSPIALFASTKFAWKSDNDLVPVAIQMDYKPDSAVYTPKDGDNWMLAKLNVQITDIGYSQIVEHLGRVHFMIEPFCVILKRTLSYQHPLNQMLKYHCRELLVPNTFGVPNLLGDFQLADLLFAYGNEGAYRLLRDAYPLTTWQITNYRSNIKKRGLDDRKLLPYFPFRDDGYLILGVIETMVEKYVNLYYKKDKDVQEDMELQAYLNELSLEGTGQNGGIGRIQEFPASINTKGELCGILSRFLSHVTIYHAAVNYVTTDYSEYIPNLPTKLYNDTRVGEGEFSVYRLPNRVTSAVQGSGFNTLGLFRLDSLFDYGNELEDLRAANLVNDAYCYLMKVIQPRLQEKNRQRKKSGDLTYPYFIPKWLPNGIQT